MIWLFYARIFSVRKVPIWEYCIYLKLECVDSNVKLLMNKPIQQIDIIKIYETKRCLVVDDLTEVRASYKRMLRSFGSQDIHTAANGDQAMELVKNHRYDIILSDYNLDESKDGQQVLEELRYMNLLKYTTLYIIITGETSREMVLGAIENQPDDYITKPISQKMMRTRLDRALIKHEQFYSIKEAMDNRNYVKAVKLCDEGIIEHKRFYWDYVRYKGQVLILMNDIEAAKDLYLNALQEKEFIWAKIGLARTLLALDEPEEVEELLKSILAIDQRYIEALDIMAENFLRQKDYEKAQDAIERATMLSPKSIIRHRQLAEIAEKNNDDEVCLKAYEEAIRWNYNSCHAEAEDYLSMARKTVEMTTGRSSKEAMARNKKAISLLDRMARRFPDKTNKLRSAFIESQLQANQGKKTLALNIFNDAEKKLEEMEFKDVDARLDHAQCNLLFGDKNKAYTDLYAIAKENKDNEKVLARIDRISDVPITVASKKCAAELSQKGIQAYQQKNYDTSMNIFKDALTMFPNHIGVNLNMLQVVLAKSDTQKCSEDLYQWCEKCLSKVKGIGRDHNQYERYQFLEKQFHKVYQEFMMDAG